MQRLLVTAACSIVVMLAAGSAVAAETMPAEQQNAPRNVADY